MHPILDSSKPVIIIYYSFSNHYICWNSNSMSRITLPCETCSHLFSHNCFADSNWQSTIVPAQNLWSFRFSKSLSNQINGGLCLRIWWSRQYQWCTLFLWLPIPLCLTNASLFWSHMACKTSQDLFVGQRIVTMPLMSFCIFMSYTAKGWTYKISLAINKLTVPLLEVMKIHGKVLFLFLSISDGWIEEEFPQQELNWLTVFVTFGY